MTPSQRSASHGSVCSINANRENGEMCEGLVDDLQHCHSFLRQSPCLFALQETDDWTVSEISAPGYVCYGWCDGRTAILCPSQLCQIRHLWENHERCKAALVASMMELSVCMPYGGMTRRITSP